MIGGPGILQSDNGSEFSSHVITELKEVWAILEMVFGKPRHPQSEESVERAHGDIKDNYILLAWMANNDSQDWPKGDKVEGQCLPFFGIFNIDFFLDGGGAVCECVCVCVRERVCVCTFYRTHYSGNKIYTIHVSIFALCLSMIRDYR